MKPTFPLVAALVYAALPAFAVPVSVTVVGPGNKPLPAAKLRWASARYSRENVAESHEQASDTGVFAWEWNGDFSKTRDEDDEKPRLRVRIEAPGMVPQFQMLDAAKRTITLQPLRVWSGVVIDQSQKPVAGATLKFKEAYVPAPKNDDEDNLDIYFDLASQTAVTDANGRWQFAGLPANGGAELALEDGRFVREGVWRTIGTGDAEPILARLGGTLTGQILAPDGSPLVGQLMQIGLGNETVTDAQGRFALDGIDPDQPLILVYIGDSFARHQKQKTLPAYFLPGFKIVKIEGGKTTALEPIQAQTGLLVKARVLDADTKKTLDDAFFRLDSNSVPNAQGDDGVLQSRVGKTDFSGVFDDPTIESEGYISYDLPVDALKTKGETLDLGTIEMKRGHRFQGVMRIEGGAIEGVSLPGIYFSRDNKSNYASVNGDGTFGSPALAAGAYSLRLASNNGGWELVSPSNAQLPAWGTNNPPLEIVVRRLKSASPIIKTARGRVLDEAGRGVAGVIVNARMTGDGGSYSSRAAMTDKDGNFTFLGDGNRTGVIFDDAQHPDYIVGGNIEVKIEGEIATLSGLIARKRGAVYSGHVIGSDGKAADKAWVCVLEARNYEPVQTDENGDFALVDLPLDKWTLVAARGRDWSTQTAQRDELGVTLQLKSSPDVVADRARVLDEMTKTYAVTSWDGLFAGWDVLGVEGVEHFLRVDGALRTDMLGIYGAELGRRDPAQLVRRAPEFTEKFEDEDLETKINLARATSDDAGARIVAGAWLDKQKLVKREVTSRSVTRLLQMARVADKLKRADAAQWLDYAASVAWQIKGNSVQNTEAWSKDLAAMGGDAVANFVEGRSAPDEFQLWGAAVPILARAGDVAGALKGLARMETLLETPAMNAVAEQTRRQQRISPTSRFERAQGAVAGMLAPTDPARAFAMAQQISDVFVRARAMISVGDGAQQAGDNQISEKALREVMKARVGNVEYFAKAAAVGARISPQLGDELFALAREKALPKDQPKGFSPPSIGAWALYHAPLDAALSRVLLEREWSWRLPAAIESRNETSSSDYDALDDLVHAMLAVDIERAGEMQAQYIGIETKNYGRPMSRISQFDVALAKLATPAQRAAMNADLKLN